MRCSSVGEISGAGAGARGPTNSGLAGAAAGSVVVVLLVVVLVSVVEVVVGGIAGTGRVVVV